MNNGISWLHDQLQANASESITYHRDALSFPYTAVPGRKTFRDESYDTGVEIKIKTSDWTITAAEILAQFGEPEEGDYILHDRQGITRKYEVKAPFGEPCFHRSNQDIDIRVHTQEIFTPVVTPVDPNTWDALGTSGTVWDDLLTTTWDQLEATA